MLNLVIKRFPTLTEHEINIELPHNVNAYRLYQEMMARFRASGVTGILHSNYIQKPMFGDMEEKMVKGCLRALGDYFHTNRVRTYGVELYRKRTPVGSFYLQK